MLYCTSHIDQPSYSAVGTMRGLECQKARITGGHLGGWPPHKTCCSSVKITWAFLFVRLFVYKQCKSSVWCSCQKCLCDIKCYHVHMWAHIHTLSYLYQSKYTCKYFYHFRAPCFMKNRYKLEYIQKKSERNLNVQNMKWKKVWIFLACIKETVQGIWRQ